MPPGNARRGQRTLFVCAFLGFDPLFHQFNNNPVGAKAALLCELRTCRAISGGRPTVWRTTLLEAAMTPLYTTMVMRPLAT